MDAWDLAPIDTARATEGQLYHTIKRVHTLIFLGELSAIAWLVLTGLLNRRDWTVAAAAAMVAGEWS